MLSVPSENSQQPFFRAFVRSLGIFWFLLALLIGMQATAFAWPTDSQWIPIPKGGSGILDDHTSGGKDGNNDANGGVNIVPYSGATPAAYTYNDGTYIHFRLRLDARPDQGGNGILAQFGWGVEIDTDQNADDYEWLIMCDGISSPEVVSLQQNTVKSGIGDPSDKAEVTVATWPMPGNHRILLAPTTINGDADYFLDFRIAYTVFKTETGITDNTAVRYFIGSSRSTNNLTDNGADLLAGTDLYSMATDFITPFGSLPPGMTFHDGTVKFVTDLNGATVRTVGAPGDTLFIRVDDLDLNNSTLPGAQITVTVTSPTGDSERVTLTAAGVAGKYTGTLATSTSSSGTNSGTLYVLSGQTVTVTYIDAIAANRSQSVPRTATIFMTGTGTDIALAKSVDLPTAGEGSLVTFTVVATNLGPNAVTSLTVTDLLPAGLTYASHSGPGGYLPGTGAWTPGAIAVGDSATLTLSATVNAGTSGSILTNTASLAASNPVDAFAGNNSASAQVAVGGTDLRITKLVDNPIPVPGGTIVYTVRATNLGPNATGGVVVRDVLPAGVNYVSDSGGGTYNPGSGNWTVGTLSSGQVAQLTITATVNAGTTGQTITNTASLLASGQPDTDPTNNSASVPILVGFTDLQLTKTARKVTPPPGPAGDSVAANVGNTVEFNVTLRNNGPHAATGVAVSDQLPAGVTYVSHAASQGAYVPGTGAWTVGTLANGATATLIIQVTVNAGTIGQTLLNTATVSAVDQPDSSPGNESDDASISVNGTDLDIGKTVSNPTPNPGDAITWTVRVTNNGPNQATGVAVTDILPVGITRTGHSASQGSWSATGGTPSWIWSVGTLNVGASATLTINTTVNTGTTGQTITNTAMITGADQADPEAANNVASAKIAVSGTDLAITKTVDNPTPNVGDTVAYTLRVTNNGPNNATGVAVTDLLPPEVTYQSHAGGTYTVATGLWSIGNLNNGASATLTINARINNGNNGLAITNTASITAVTQGDPNLTNNSANVVVTVGSTNLAVTKSVNNPTPLVSAAFTYTVTVTNTGANTATGVELEDVLPASVTQSGYVASQGTFSGGLWLVGTLNPGGSATLQITASANAGTAGSTITNTASLQRLNQVDINATDNSASVEVVPLAGPSLTFMKSLQTLSDPVKGTTNPFNIPGAEILYSLNVTNTGTVAPDNGSLTITDPVPAGTALFIGDIGGSPAGSPVAFVDGAGLTASNLGISFISLASMADSLSFSNDGGATFVYDPSTDADVDGFNSSVTHLRVNLNGTMNVSDGTNHPTFTLRFKVRID